MSVKIITIDIKLNVYVSTSIIHSRTTLLDEKMSISHLQTKLAIGCLIIVNVGSTSTALHHYMYLPLTSKSFVELFEGCIINNNNLYFLKQYLEIFLVCSNDDIYYKECYTIIIIKIAKINTGKFSK